MFSRLPTLHSHARFAVAVLAAMALAGPGLAHAQWKWRDASGRITVSDLPPPRGTPDKDILQRPEPPARRAGPATPAASAPASAPAAAASPSPAVDRELESRKRAAEQERQSRSKADEERLAAQRAENCQRARAQLSALESGQRMSRINERGEREFLDDDARAAETRRARDVVASDCR